MPARRFSDGNHQVLRRRLLRNRRSGALQVEDEAFNAAAKADAGGGAPAQLLHQPIVASAAADGGLGAGHGGLDFKDGAGVVVQPAHQAMVNPVGDAGGFQVGLHPPPVAVAVGAEARHGLGCFLAQGAAGFDLAVQQAQGVAFQPGAAVGA